MWQRLWRPAFVRPAASLLALQVWPSFQSSQQFHSSPCIPGRLPFAPLGNSVVSCSPKAALFTCTSCSEALSRDSFAGNQVKRSTRICKGCAGERQSAAAVNFTCTQCCEDLSSECFAHDQVKRSTRICKGCAGERQSAAAVNAAVNFTCTQCYEDLSSECFARDQRHRSTRVCSSCSHPRPAEFLICSDCGESLQRESFSKDRQRQAIKICKGCSSIGRPSIELARIALGSLSEECSYCSAQRFPCEGDSFCCGHGKHFVDFSKYYEPPNAALMKIFGSSWMYTDAKGNAVHDALTNAPRMTGFSAMSRRYNALFSLAMHVMAHNSENLNFDQVLRIDRQVKLSDITTVFFE